MSVLTRMFKPLRSYLKQRQRERETQARQAVFESERWSHGGDLARRQYASYEAYAAHQSAKLDKIFDRLQRKAPEDLAIFTERFRGCRALSEARSVLCLGARLGTEVRALHSLGYFAVGVDLNPGPDNPYVLSGDFHSLVFADSSVDAIYTNALDHVFDLDKVVGEVRRLLRLDGLFVVDVIVGYEEGFVAGDYEALHWRNAGAFIDKIREAGGFTLEEFRDLGRIRRDCWKQAVLRKSADRVCEC